MSMRGAVAACVVLMCLVALQVERSEGHVTFFSPKEIQVLKGKKDMEPRSEDGQFEDVTVQQLPETDGAGNSDKSVEISVRLTPQQLDHVAPVLEEFLHEIVEEHQRAK